MTGPQQKAFNLLEDCCNSYGMALHVADEFIGHAMKSGDIDEEMEWAEVMHILCPQKEYDS
jgi:hypothetical protein